MQEGRLIQKPAGGISGPSFTDRITGFRRRASNAYREAKGAMSSELEGLVLKATRPDDGPVKQKHLTSLFQPADELPKEFNVYFPVVRQTLSREVQFGFAMDIDFVIVAKRWVVPESLFEQARAFRFPLLCEKCISLSLYLLVGHLSMMSIFFCFIKGLSAMGSPMARGMYWALMQRRVWVQSGYSPIQLSLH